MATNKNEHLQKVLETHDINKVENIDKFIAKKNKVKEALNNKFSSEKASNSIDSGSYAKKTAINTKFDIDCCIPFLKKEKEDDNGFATLEEMFDSVYKYLRNEYTEEDDDIIKEDVRKQKVSIGLKFDIDGEDFQMDVVPGRERPKNSDYNSNNTDLSLHIHPPNRSKKEEDEGKIRIKTNIKKHVDLLAGSGRVHERKVAKLLKVWKTERKNKNGGKLIKSFMMELYTKEAFDNSDEIPIGLWEKVKMVMNHIIDNITENNLVDPVNSSNIVSDAMSDTAKSDTKRDMKKTIKEVDEDSDKIKEYFPINEDYNDDDNGSESKSSSASVLSTSKFG
ncbi:hypothetical protein NO995_11030 [Aestuariibaculum sp. M13]|uniref:SMODS domain-containing nucleotidyltransferase n=1 Tax=Aestuariibaculum sp. M13 TaxID=2967132 RepID=UPI00215A08A9|nr:hypothetical protein [Aestuariibaculum sp. M13]MCR8668219.1 hypothetical protein [Aestuariibaculum sp. M13]